MKRLTILGCGLAMSVLGGCAGTAEAGEACAASSDCVEGTDCVPPVRLYGWGPACGVGCSVNTDCQSDADCAGRLSGELCLNYLGLCCGPNAQLSTRCGPVCDDDASCGDGFRCAADGRGCEPVMCDEGFQCPTQTDCDPSAAPEWRCEHPGFCGGHELNHGCVRRACSGDGQCDAGGVCVVGTCQDGHGTCQGPRP